MRTRIATLLLAFVVGATAASAYWYWSEQRKNALIAKALANIEASTGSPKDGESCETTMYRVTLGQLGITNTLPRSCRETTP